MLSRHIHSTGNQGVAFEDGAMIFRILPSTNDAMVGYNGSFSESSSAQSHHQGQYFTVLGIFLLGSLDTFNKG